MALLESARRAGPGTFSNVRTDVGIRKLRLTKLAQLRLKLAALAVAFGSTFAPTAHAAEIQLYPGKAGEPAIIYVGGEITSGDETRFSAVATATPSALVVLNSAGGALKPALEIGKATRLRGYTTVVYKGASCASACALIWTAGSRRIIADTGRVGFHASYFDDSGKLVETGVGNAVVGHYLAQLGYSESAVIFATSAPPDKILWLDARTASQSGIAYETLPSDGSRPTSSVGDSLPSSNVFEGADAYASAPMPVRSVDAFAAGLKRSSYKAQVDKSDASSPKIFTEASGYKMLIAFSSCAAESCKYAELIAIWEGVTPQQASEVVRKYALEENFANIYYDKAGQNLSVYHYIILGSDGITVSNLIDNITYFARDFGEVASVVSAQK